jgi:predicted phosphoribosyltransferase
MPFADRTQAGRALAAALLQYRDERPVVLALPRGGVPVAAEVARSLRAPLDLMLVRKIGVPTQPELAMGAVVDGANPITVRNEDVIEAAGVTGDAFAQERERALKEIARRHEKYLGRRAAAAVEGHTAIVVDDGIATGATIRAGLRATKARKPAKLVLAVPVAPTETLEALRKECDDVVCLESYRDFYAIGPYYRDFSQLSDEDVIRILAEFPTKPAA